MQVRITHLLAFTSAIVVLILLRPVAVAVIILGPPLYCFLLAISDISALFKTRKRVPLNDDEYYSQFDPKPRMAILLAIIAMTIYLTGWLVGAFAEPGLRPMPATLIADIVFTVVGLAFCFYAHKKSATYFQTALTWVPLCCWMVHFIVLLSHGLQIEKVSVAG